MIVLVLISLLAGPVWSNVAEDEHLETVLAVTQCRASCLDQFSHLIRNEENCMKESNCFMCWEMCRMVMESFEIWGPLCLVRDVCPPGCQLACNFVETENNGSFSSGSTLMVRNVYEPHTDRVSIEWVLDRDLESDSAVLYSVLLKDENQQWNQIAQTTSHVVHIKRGLLGRNTEIRVIAANATNQVSDSKTSYLASHVSETSTDSLIKNPKKLWKPSLESLIKHGMGLQATIVWPVRHHENGSMQYEVSWSVIDDSIEVTGHLHTTNNAAILTLWPNSVYSVQVTCFGADKILHSQSEPLVVDTKSSHINKEIEKISAPSCSGQAVAINAFAVISAFFLLVIIIAIIWVLKNRRPFMGNNVCKVENKTGKAQIIQMEPAKLISLSSFKHEQEKTNQLTLEEKSRNFHLI